MPSPYSKNINIVKSNCYGNSFVILDQLAGATLSEAELRQFAAQATDVNFGIGADNLLVLQPYDRAVLESINRSNGYWRDLPRLEASHIFRMFEPDGTEALCCGNGLMCISNYLAEAHGVEHSRILTEVPLRQSNVMAIGTDSASGYSWVDLGEPRRAPEDVVGPGLGDRFIGSIQEIGNLRVKFREHDLKPYSNLRSIELEGYLVFTGEPHLVVYPADGGISVPEIADAVFANSQGNRGAGPIFRQRIRFGTWLIDRIGHYLNANYRAQFPIGINVNFVRTDLDDGVLEYRCFERGINRETLACGTGAMAVVYVTKQLFDRAEETIRILPHRCRWYRDEAEIEVRQAGSAWYLRGRPEIVFSGQSPWVRSTDGSGAARAAGAPSR